MILFELFIPDTTCGYYPILLAGLNWTNRDFVSPYMTGADPAQNLNVAHLKWRHMTSPHITIHDVIYLFVDRTKWNWTAQISSTVSNFFVSFHVTILSQISPSRKMFSRESKRLLLRKPTKYGWLKYGQYGWLRKPGIFHGIL